MFWVSHVYWHVVYSSRCGTWHFLCKLFSELPRNTEKAEIIAINTIRNFGPGKWYLDFVPWHHGKIKFSIVKPKKTPMRNYYLILFAKSWQVWRKHGGGRDPCLGYNSKACSWRKLLISMRLITFLRTSTLVTLTRTVKQGALEFIFSTWMEQAIKGDIRQTFLATLQDFLL